jgi:hypothetical protein
MTEPLPSFRYHPDPVATGSIEPSDAVCRCCGRARGYIYAGPVCAEAVVNEGTERTPGFIDWQPRRTSASRGRSGRSTWPHWTPTAAPRPTYSAADTADSSAATAISTERWHGAAHRGRAARRVV